MIAAAHIYQQDKGRQHIIRLFIASQCDALECAGSTALFFIIRAPKVIAASLLRKATEGKQAAALQISHPSLIPAEVPCALQLVGCAAELSLRARFCYSAGMKASIPWTAVRIKAAKGREKIVCLTAYDYATARLARNIIRCPPGRKPRNIRLGAHGTSAGVIAATHISQQDKSQQHIIRRVPTNINFFSRYNFLHPIFQDKL